MNPQDYMPSPAEREQCERIQQAATQFREAIERTAGKDYKVIVHWQLVRTVSEQLVRVNGGYSATIAQWNIWEVHHSTISLIDNTIKMFPPPPLPSSQL